MRRRVALTASAVAGALPWTWFLVRNASGRMDAVALLWPLIALAAVVALLIFGAVARRVEPVLSALSWVVAFLVVVVVPWRPFDGPSPVNGLRVAAANAFDDNHELDNLARDVLAEHPDVLVISEVRDPLDDLLTPRFRYRVRSGNTGSDQSDVAVYSRWPLHPSELPPALRGQRGSRMVVDVPTGPIVLYAMHLQKPGAKPSRVEVGFRTHRRIIDHLALAAGREKGPVVVAGDLNLSDRTSGYRSMTRVLDDAMRAGWVRPTSLRSGTRWLLARIDHIFMPEHWCSAHSSVFRLRGSDHRGVAVTVGRCPGRDDRPGVAHP